MTERDEEILALHRQVAAERLRADQGWERAEAKSRECLNLRERIADQEPLVVPGKHAVFPINILGAPMRLFKGEWESATWPSEKPVVPEGWALVPIEPTPEMWAAVNKVDNDMFAGGNQHGAEHGQVWSAMLEAAKETSHVPT